MSKIKKISRNDYDLIKNIIKNSSCMSVAYNTAQEKLQLDYDSAFRITQAVDNDYKYLKIEEQV